MPGFVDAFRLVSVEQRQAIVNAVRTGNTQVKWKKDLPQADWASRPLCKALATPKAVHSFFFPSCLEPRALRGFALSVSGCLVCLGDAHGESGHDGWGLGGVGRCLHAKESLALAERNTSSHVHHDDQ